MTVRRDFPVMETTGQQLVISFAEPGDADVEKLRLVGAEAPRFDEIEQVL